MRGLFRKRRKKPYYWEYSERIARGSIKRVLSIPEHQRDKRDWDNLAYYERCLDIAVMERLGLYDISPESMWQ